MALVLNRIYSRPDALGLAVVLCGLVQLAQSANPAVAVDLSRPSAVVRSVSRQMVRVGLTLCRPVFSRHPHAHSLYVTRLKHMSTNSVLCAREGASAQGGVRVGPAALCPRACTYMQSRPAALVLITLKKTGSDNPSSGTVKSYQRFRQYHRSSILTDLPYRPVEKVGTGLPA